MRLRAFHSSALPPASSIRLRSARSLGDVVHRDRQVGEFRDQRRARRSSATRSTFAYADFSDSRLSIQAAVQTGRVST